MSKTLLIILIIIIIVGGVGVWFWQKHQFPVPVQTEQKAPPVPQVSAVSDFKNYAGATLPSQFPKDFPNPAKEGEVVASISMKQNQSLAVDQSIFKFNTQISMADISKLYNDYLVKNKWVLSSRAGSSTTTYMKDDDIISFIVQADGNKGNLVTISFTHLNRGAKTQ